MGYYYLKKLGLTLPISFADLAYDISKRKLSGFGCQVSALPPA
jgi:hypothetical protein